MALDKDKLATELENMTPIDSEATAINTFATAFETYFYDAVAGDGLPEPVVSIPVAPGTLEGATTAMKAAMVDLSTAGSAAIQAGVVAFWTVVVAGTATIFPTTTAAVAPADLAGISSALDTAFAANTASENTLADAAASVADAIHTTQTVPPGTATAPGPTALTIT